MSDEFMKIKELLEKKTGRKAVIKKMVKNNGTSYTGVFVEFESTNTLPVINLDAFYDECKAQKLSIEEITDKIIAVLNENTSESFNTEAFTNFSDAQIYCIQTGSGSNCILGWRIKRNFSKF